MSAFPLSSVRRSILFYCRRICYSHDCFVIGQVKEYIIEIKKYDYNRVVCYVYAHWIVQTIYFLSILIVRFLKRCYLSVISYHIGAFCTDILVMFCVALLLLQCCWDNVSLSFCSFNDVPALLLYCIHLLLFYGVVLLLSSKGMSQILEKWAVNIYGNDYFYTLENWAKPHKKMLKFRANGALSYETSLTSPTWTLVHARFPWKSSSSFSCQKIFSSIGNCAFPCAHVEFLRLRQCNPV